MFKHFFIPLNLNRSHFSAQKNNLVRGAHSKKSMLRIELGTVHIMLIEIEIQQWLYWTENDLD